MATTTLKRRAADSRRTDDLTHEPSCCFPHERLCGIPAAISTPAPDGVWPQCIDCATLLTVSAMFDLPCAVLRQIR